MLVLRRVMWSFYLPDEKHICAIYQQKVGIPMGTNCAPLTADLFLYCYERDFMSDLHKSKRHDLIDMFKDTSRYLDDIFTIDNHEFEKYIPDIYPSELQLYKANTSDKETSFLDLNIKVIGSDIHTSVYEKRDDFGFPFGFTLFGQFWAYIFKFLNYFLWLRITDEGSVPEMRIWSISLIKSDLKWCIHLSRSLFFNSYC